MSLNTDGFFLPFIFIHSMANNDITFKCTVYGVYAVAILYKFLSFFFGVFRQSIGFISIFIFFVFFIKKKFAIKYCTFALAWTEMKIENNELLGKILTRECT